MALHLISSCLPHTHYQIPTCSSLPRSHNNAPVNRRYHVRVLQHGVKAHLSVDTTKDQRRSANYQPSVWNYNFIQSLEIRYADEKYKNTAKKLEEEVRCMMKNEESEMLNILELIDDIQRLGLGHRFEKDINRALDRILSWEGFHNVKADEKLHATALRFRLLRQNGYHVSQDVFKTFVDEEGKLIADGVENDVKGLLSLYEASFLASEGENILDEAQASRHLNGLKSQAGPAQVLRITHALDLPLHHRMPRLEARWCIEAYSQRNDANPSLIELAKLDFNMFQSHLQTELKETSRWWNQLDLAKNLYFARDRLMECFIWAVGIIPDQRFPNCRQEITKVVSFITIIDDIYDVYGTLEELELFTEAVERWDLTIVNDLPEYMQLCFMALYNTVNEMAYNNMKKHRENTIPYLTKAWVDMCKAFLQEAKWSHSKYTPTFENYLDNAWRSVSGVLCLVHSYFLVSESINKEALESLQKQHDLMRWPSIIFRLLNDLGTSTAEIERGETASSIVCYMRDTGVSEEVAREHIRNMIDETWKKMNKAVVDDDNPFGKTFVETALNLARWSECNYQHGDGLGAPDARAKQRILSLIIEPISTHGDAIA